MKHFNDWLTLAFGTPVVAAVATYVLAHLTGIIKVLKGGNISIQQVEAAVEAVDPGLVADLKAKLAKAEQDALNAEGRLQAEVQIRAAALLESWTKELAGRLAAASPPPVEPPVEPAQQ